MAIRKINSRSLVSAVTTNPIFSGTDSLIAPKGTTAQRNGTPVEGMLRYNTTLGVYEQYTAQGWNAIAASPAISSVSPTAFNGEQGTSFTINGTSFDTNAQVKFVTSGGTEISAATVSYVNNSQLTANSTEFIGDPLLV